MTTLDRYISRLFFFNFVVLFVVVFGLYALLDLIINFDEFSEVLQENPGTPFQKLLMMTKMLAGWYFPRLALIYVYTAGLLPIGAAGFTLAGMIRNRELIAMLAGGLSMHRIALPMLAVTFGINGILFATQELIIPPLAHRLMQSHDEAKHGRAKDIRLTFMPDEKGNLFTSHAYSSTTEAMIRPTILRRQKMEDGSFGPATERIVADQAVWDAKRQGWELANGYALASDYVQAMEETEAINHHLREVAFFPSSLTPETILLKERDRYRQLLSFWQLSQLIDSATTHSPQVRELVRIRHSRISILVINVLIFLIGLPYFMLRSPAPLLTPSLKAAAMCVPAWAGGFLMYQISPETLPPAAVAWLPVALYLPIAYYKAESIET